MKNFILIFFILIFSSSCATTKVKVGERIRQSDQLEKELDQKIKEEVKEPVKQELEKREEKTPVVKKETEKKEQVFYRKLEIPFSKGEERSYQVFLKGINSGTAVISVLDKKNDLYYFGAEIKTNELISMFFEVRHSIVSTWSKNKGSQKFSFKGVEGSTKKERLEKVSLDQMKAYSIDKEIKEGKEDKDTKEFNIKEPVEDFLSSFFFVRSIDWGQIKSKKFDVLDNGKLQEVKATFLKEETIEIGNKKFETMIVDVFITKDNSKLNKFWIEKRTKKLVKIQAQLKIGLMTLEIKE